MSVIGLVGEYERQLLSWGPSVWDKRAWPAEGAHAGMRVARLHRMLPNGDQVMLHRFMPDHGDQEPHAHPMAVAAHVLGPGEYEVGFVVGDACQARMITDRPFYYEMRTHEVRHFVLPRTGPIYSVAVWTAFPPRVAVPEPMRVSALLPPEGLLHHVQGTFEALYRAGAAG